MERLQRILAARGIASRRRAEEMIVEGRVRVDGKVVTELGTKVDPETQKIEVDGKLIPNARRRYILLHKPAGYITTTSDERDRLTVMDLVDTSDRVIPVGRLDRPTEGLLLLTNDGEVAYRVMHPRFELDKEYEALLDGHPPAAALEQLRRGIVVDDQRAKPDVVRPIRNADEGTVVRVVIHEGRNRIVRRMFDEIGYPVLRLVRTRIGPLHLAGIPRGAWRDLTDGELDQLREALHLTDEDELTRDSLYQSPQPPRREPRAGGSGEQGFGDRRPGGPPRYPTAANRSASPRPRPAASRPYPRRDTAASTPFPRRPRDDERPAPADRRPPFRRDSELRNERPGSPPRDARPPRGAGPPPRRNFSPPTRDAAPPRRGGEGPRPPRDPRPWRPLEDDVRPDRRFRDGAAQPRDAGPPPPPEHDHQPARRDAGPPGRGVDQPARDNHSGQRNAGPARGDSDRPWQGNRSHGRDAGPPRGSAGPPRRATGAPRGDRQPSQPRPEWRQGRAEGQQPSRPSPARNAPVGGGAPRAPRSPRPYGDARRRYDAPPSTGSRGPWKQRPGPRGGSRPAQPGPGGKGRGKPPVHGDDRRTSGGGQEHGRGGGSEPA